MNKIEYIGKSLLINGSVLVIGDLHLGYQGSLHESGYQIPVKLYEETISDLDEIFDKIGARKIDKVIILGDLKHEFGKILSEEWKEVLDFLDYLKKKTKEIVFVKGNHDAITENITKKKDVNVVDYYLLEDISFLHGDKDFSFVHDKKIKMWVVGHAHPAIVLEEKKGIKKEKYKCFLEGKYKRKKIIIVPSFLPLNEGTDVRSGYNLGLAWDFKLDKFNVKIVGENLEVLDFGEAGKL